MYARRIATHILLTLMLSLATASAAPVPPPPPPAPCPIVPGYRWWFCANELQVTRVEGEVVWYRNLTCPERTWPSSVPGIDTPNVQRKHQVRQEKAAYYQPPRLHWNRLVFQEGD